MNEGYPVQLLFKIFTCTSLLFFFFVWCFVLFVICCAHPLLARANFQPISIWSTCSVISKGYVHICLSFSLWELIQYQAETSVQGQIGTYPVCVITMCCNTDVLYSRKFGVKVNSCVQMRCSVKPTT